MPSRRGLVKSHKTTLACPCVSPFVVVKEPEKKETDRIYNTAEARVKQTFYRETKTT